MNERKTKKNNHSDDIRKLEEKAKKETHTHTKQDNGNTSMNVSCTALTSSKYSR